MIMMNIFELIAKTILTKIPLVNRMQFVYTLLGVKLWGG